MIIKINKFNVGGKMRRPLLVIFIFLLFQSFVYTKDKPLDNIKDKEKITIEGIVKNKKNKTTNKIIILQTCINKKVKNLKKIEL